MVSSGFGDVNACTLSRQGYNVIKIANYPGLCVYGHVSST